MTALLLIAALGLAAPAAGAAADARRFDVRPGSPLEALAALAAQGRLSIGGDLAACGPRLAGVQGRMDAAAALRRLLADAPCEAVEADASTFRIRRRGPARAPAPRPARPSPPAPGPGPAPTVGEVVVTADRRRTPLARFAGSVTVASGREMELSGRSDLASLAAVIPELTATNLGPGRDKFFLRGVSDGVFTGASPPTVAIYLDDLPLTYNAPDPDLRLVDIDRVEVVAGPQGTLYGAGAIGGVLRIVSRAPDPDAAAGEVQAALSSTAHGGLGQAVQGWANTPLAAGRLALRVSGYAERTGGWLDDPALGRSDTNGSVRLGGRAALLWRLSQTWSVQLAAAGQALDTADAQYVLAGAPALVRTTDVLEPHDNDFATVSLGVQGELPFGRLKLAAARITHRTDTRYDATDALAAFGGAPGSGPAAYDEGARRGLTFAEATLSSREGAAGSWLLGAFLASSQEDANDRLAGLAGLPPLYQEVRKDIYDEEAIYGEYGLRLGSRLTVRLGARLSRSTLSTSSLVTEPATSAASRPFVGEASTLRLLPRLAAELALTPRLFVYFDAADGYRPAGLNTAGPLSQTFDTPGEPPRQVRSDVARSYELGVRWTASRRLKLSGAVFYTDWLGVRSDQYSAFGLPYSVNVGDAAIDGGDVAVTWAAGPVEVRGSAFFADPQLTQDRNLAFPSRSDAGLPGVADDGASLQVSYRRRVWEGLAFDARVHGDYVGPSSITFDAAPRGRFGDYVEGGLSAELRGRFTTVGLEVDNLADRRADTFAFGNPFSFAQTRQLTPLRPRTVTLRVSRSF